MYSYRNINGNTDTGNTIVQNLTVSQHTVIKESLNVDSNTFYVDNTNNRVGILNPTPTEELDVVGNIKASGNLGVGKNPTHKLDVLGDINTSTRLKINGSEVISATGLGSSVVSSSLTSVGALGNLTVSGHAAVGGTLTADTVVSTQDIVAPNIHSGPNVPISVVLIERGEYTEVAEWIQSTTYYTMFYCVYTCVGTGTVICELDLKYNVNGSGSDSYAFQLCSSPETNPTSLTEERYKEWADSVREMGGTNLRGKLSSLGVGNQIRFTFRAKKNSGDDQIWANFDGITFKITETT